MTPFYFWHIAHEEDKKAFWTFLLFSDCGGKPSTDHQICRVNNPSPWHGDPANLVMTGDMER